VSDDVEALERRIEQLRTEVRLAVLGGDRLRAREIRVELREAEQRWDESLAELAELTEQTAHDREVAPEAGAGQVAAPRSEPTGPRAIARTSASGTSASGTSAPGTSALQPGPLLPAREQVHQALTLLGAPAAPRLIVAVHNAFSAGILAGSRLTSLRRDEERSFRVAPYGRPYYLCAALTADLLAPARGLLAVSTWPMDRRVVGPLSPRVDYLTAAIAVAERLQRMPDATAHAERLLWGFASNIPRAAASFRTMNPGDVATAARAELAVHLDADSAHRAAAARRARRQLDEAEQLFGSGLRISHPAGADTGA
jgi:hypothetical protein